MTRSMISRLCHASLAAASALLGSVIISSPPASASSSIPFKDPYASGTLTLCGRDNRPVTSGSILTAPFVWSAISSTPAPAGYSRAYLLVYQPIQYEDPSNWTGAQLTEDSIFSNRSHPVTQATNADVPLLYSDRSMPPRWNGLYELRMYFTAPNEPVSSTPYPAAVIQVSGETWKLLTPATTPCNSGSAVSAETFVLPKAELAAPQSIIVDSQPAKGPTETTPQGRPAVVPPVPLGGARGIQKVAAAPVAAKGEGSPWVPLVAGAAGAAAVAGGATVAMRRRRRSVNGRAGKDLGYQ